MDLFSEGFLDWYLSLFHDHQTVGTWLVILTTILMLAIPLNYYKYRKEIIKDTQMWCSICLGVSYASTDYLMAALYYSLENFYELFAGIKAIFPVYTLFDVVTMAIIWLLAVLFRKDKRVSIPSSVSFVIFLLGVNALSHVYFFWVSLFTGQEGLIFRNFAVIYSICVNFNDLLLMFTVLFFGTTEVAINKIKSLLKRFFKPSWDALLSLFPKRECKVEL